MCQHCRYGELAPSYSRQLTLREAADAFRPGADPDERNAHAGCPALPTVLASDHAACPRTIEVPGVAATPDLLSSSPVGGTSPNSITTSPMCVSLYGATILKYLGV
jgi:hypothetical protein